MDVDTACDWDETRGKPFQCSTVGARLSHNSIVGSGGLYRKHLADDNVRWAVHTKSVAAIHSLAPARALKIHPVFLGLFLKFHTAFRKFRSRLVDPDGRSTGTRTTGSHGGVVKPHPFKTPWPFPFPVKLWAHVTRPQSNSFKISCWS